jgi:hypothetical protein
MKPKTFLALLVPLLVLALIVPVSGYYEPMQDRNYDDGSEDHPWGGDDGSSDDGITGKDGEFAVRGTHFIIIDIIRIVVVPLPDFSRDYDASAGTTDNMLPDYYDSSNTKNRGDSGKGKM